MNGKILKLACKNIEQNNVTSASTEFSILYVTYSEIALCEKLRELTSRILHSLHQITSKIY